MKICDICGKLWNGDITTIDNTDYNICETCKLINTIQSWKLIRIYELIKKQNNMGLTCNAMYFAYNEMKLSLSKRFLNKWR